MEHFGLSIPFLSHSQLNFDIFAEFVVLGVGSIMGLIILIGEIIIHRIKNKTLKRWNANANAKIDILLCSFLVHLTIFTHSHLKNSFLSFFFIFQSISNLSRSFRCSACLKLNIFKVNSNQKSTTLHFSAQQICNWKICIPSRSSFEFSYNC